jgi:hypothetical protein
VLYDDPIGGYPPTYGRDDIPKIERYHGGQTTPTPKGIDFSPGELLGCVSGAIVRTGGHQGSSLIDRFGPLATGAAFGDHERAYRLDGAVSAFAHRGLGPTAPLWPR